VADIEEKDAWIPTLVEFSDLLGAAVRNRDISIVQCGFGRWEFALDPRLSDDGVPVAVVLGPSIRACVTRFPDEPDRPEKRWATRAEVYSALRIVDGAFQEEV
jgi:hypothetical protein